MTLHRHGLDSRASGIEGAVQRCRDSAVSAAWALRLPARCAMAIATGAKGSAQAHSLRHVGNRTVRKCRPALWSGQRDAVRRQLLPAWRRFLFPDRRVGGWQNLAAQAAVSCPTSQPGRHPPVRRGCGDASPQAPAGLPPSHRRRIPGFPAGLAPVRLRQYRAAVARRRHGRKRDRRIGFGNAQLGGPGRSWPGAPGNAVGR